MPIIIIPNIIDMMTNALALLESWCPPLISPTPYFFIA